MRNGSRRAAQTLTRGVDHDGGRHQPSRAPRGPIICPGCGSWYQHRRWSLRGQHAETDRVGGPIVLRVCPACRQRPSGLPHGFIHADGEFARAHRAGIEALLRADAARAHQENSLAQVLDWGDDGCGGLLVTTTTEHLAIRLGRTLEQAHDGQLLFGFSHKHKLVHTWWHRDA